MSRLVHHFATMAYNNAWSNHRLLGAVNLLTPAEFAATRPSFFPSLRATLNHNITVDWYYVDALERGLQSRPVNTEGLRFFDPEQPFATCEPLRAAQRTVDRRLIDLSVALDDEVLDRPIGIQRGSGIDYETVTRLLAHLFQHQIHHRGQAHAMLAGTEVKPPQLDEFFCATEAHLRAADLAELGYSEEMIWGTHLPEGPRVRAGGAAAEGENASSASRDARKPS
jgi:uncharacterized damage-inducible protein DinB